METNHGDSPLKKTNAPHPVVSRLLCSVYPGTAALAGSDVPFKGTVSGHIPVNMGPPVLGSGGCVFNFIVDNAGNATQLGHFTGTANFIPNVCTGSYTGSYNWTAANGDSISGPFFGQLIPTGTPGVFENTETAIITGGTGRFADATGEFTLHGQVD